MEAQILEIYPQNPDLRKIDEVVNCLKSGGIIIYPTDTVYSMGCDSRNAAAVERLCKLKNTKTSQNNFSIVCKDISDISNYAKVPNVAFRFMKKVLPGPYTFILPATSGLPKLLQTNRKTIGVRVIDHKIPELIIEALGGPLITTSVKDDIDDILEYPNEIETIFDQNQNRVDLIISGSWCGIMPSTVLDATSESDLLLIREGLGEFEGGK